MSVKLLRKRRRKTHKWKVVSSIFVRCPYCGSWKTFQRTAQIGLRLFCGTCDRYFELGLQAESK